jgi:D-serine dehydratase
MECYPVTVDIPTRPARLRDSLLKLDSSLVSGRTKGLPPGLNETALGRLASLGLNVLRQDLAFPAAVLRDSALQRNRLWMRRFLEHTGALIAPHAKTTMAPHLMALQHDDGAWGFTVATANQAAVLRQFGFNRLLIANQLVGHANIDYLYSELERDPQFDLYVIVDSHEALNLLIARASLFPRARPMQLLLEVGWQGGRTGCRNLDHARDLAQAVSKAGASVVLRGVEAYESVFPSLAAAEKFARVDQMLDVVLELATDCRQAGWFAPGPVVLTAGGSEYFDRVITRLKQWRCEPAPLVIIRSGCYLSHDDLAYARAFDLLLARNSALVGLAPPLTAALEVWAVVQSRPEAELALLTVGKRDISFDFEMPMPKLWYRPAASGGVAPLPSGYAVTRLNDQHGFLRCPADSPLAVGDLIGLGISHPCTTFDKWEVIPVVDDAYTVCGAVRTFF